MKLRDFTRRKPFAHKVSTCLVDDCSNSEPLEGTGWRQTFYGNQEERDEGKLITDPRGVGSGVNR